MATTEEILNQLLSLPPDTRARVAQRLLESLGSADSTIKELWDAEIESRLEAYDRGELQAVPGDKVLARLREKFPRKV
jgi:putative addiction module component (TIGR02574 family)